MNELGTRWRRIKRGVVAVAQTALDGFVADMRWIADHLHNRHRWR